MRILTPAALAAALLVSACGGRPVTAERPVGENAEWTEPAGEGIGFDGGGNIAAVDPAPAAEPEPAPLSREEQLQEDLLQVGDRVFFDYDKSTFLPEGEETLRRQARFLASNPDITVTIEGHCDERGTREYNIALGERRAEASKAYLVSLGVDPVRVSTISYGKERPTVTGHDEVSWSQNRVAVTVVNQ